MRSKLLLCCRLAGRIRNHSGDRRRARPPEIVNPSVLQPRAPAGRLQTMMNVAPRAAAPAPELRDIVYDLIVKYTEWQLWNPTTNRQDKVKLRSYQGRGVNPDAPFVGPQIEVYPGQTVRMTLHNKLPADPTCPRPRRQRQRSALLQRHQPAHPRPVGQSERQQRQRAAVDQSRASSSSTNTTSRRTIRRAPSGITAPARLDRAAGVQRHGRRADRARHAPPTPTAWRYRHPAAADQRPGLDRARAGVAADPICLPRRRTGKIKHDQRPRRPLSSATRAISAASRTMISSAPAPGRNRAASPRINGVVLPAFSGATPGKVERWRMIHGGVRDTISLQFRKRTAAAPEPTGLRAGRGTRPVSITELHGERRCPIIWSRPTA